MRCNPWRWLWGLPLLAMWVWISGLLEQDRIETDLRTRSGEALSAAGYGWAKPNYGYRDGSLSGTAPSEAQAAEALDVVRKVWGVRIADGTFETMRSVVDYTWTARRDGEALTISGFAPDETVRDEVIAAIKRRFPDANVTNNHPLLTGMIVLAHLKESLEYYLRLDVAEIEGDVLKAIVAKAPEKLQAKYKKLTAARRALAEAEAEALR